MSNLINVDLSIENPLPAQQECISAFRRGVRFLGMKGGRRSGKTFLMARLFWEQLIKKPDEYWIAVPTFQQMGGSQKMFERGTEMNGKVIYTVPPDFYKWFIVRHDKVKKTYDCRNGSKVKYKTGEREDDYRGDPIGGVWLDEGSQQSKTGVGSLRFCVADKQGFMYLSTTPRGTKNWDCEWTQKMLQGDKNYFVAYGSTLDNTNLPQQERDALLKDFSGKWLEQEIYGRDVDFAGIIFDCFQPARDFYEQLPGTLTDYRWYQTNDYGFPKPSTNMYIACRNQLNPVTNLLQTVYYIEDEIYEIKCMPQDMGKMCKDNEKNYETVVNQFVRYGDSKDPKNNLLFCEGHGKDIFIRCYPQGRDDVGRSIKLMYNLIRDGRVKVNKRKCKHFMDEVSNYAFKEGTDEPQDDNNHCIDPIRGLLYALERFAKPKTKTHIITRVPVPMSVEEYA